MSRHVWACGDCLTCDILGLDSNARALGGGDLQGHARAGSLSCLHSYIPGSA